MERRSMGTTRHSRLPVRVLAALLLVGTAGLVACEDDGVGNAGPTTTPQPTASRPTTPAAVPRDVALNDLLADPAAYDDLRLRVSGVADQHAQVAFSLVPPAEVPAAATADPSRGKPAVLVLHAPDTRPRDGDAVVVTGEVHDPVDVDAIERALGVELGGDLTRVLRLDQADAVLVADGVRIG
jgi:hypothetical protein